MPDLSDRVTFLVGTSRERAGQRGDLAKFGTAHAWENDTAIVHGRVTVAPLYAQLHVDGSVDLPRTRSRAGIAIAQKLMRLVSGGD